jgi:hypothetical protein
MDVRLDDVNIDRCCFVSVAAAHLVALLSASPLYSMPNLLWRAASTFVLPK